MPWTTPGTATAGDVLTAAFWNTQVRDNFSQLRALVNVQSAFKEDVFTSSAPHNSYQDITGLSVSITPRETTSKVLIHFSLSMTQSTNAASHLQAKLVRGSTDIAVPTTSPGTFASTIGFTQQNYSDITQISFTFLDSPNTTSATTYKLQGRNSSTVTWYVNQRGDAATRSTSSITVIEIPS